MTDNPTMTQEQQLRSVGVMLEALGCVLQMSAGNAEDDYQAWLSDCQDHEIPGSDEQLRNWYLCVLNAAGITNNAKGPPA